jgi:hypothetical protein
VFYNIIRFVCVDGVFDWDDALHTFNMQQFKNAKNNYWSFCFPRSVGSSFQYRLFVRVRCGTRILTVGFCSWTFLHMISAYNFCRTKCRSCYKMCLRKHKRICVVTRRMVTHFSCVLTTLATLISEPQRKRFCFICEEWNMRCVTLSHFGCRNSCKGQSYWLFDLVNN